MGLAIDGRMLVVVHTWVEVDVVNVNVRIISARTATPAEQLAYEDSL